MSKIYKRQSIFENLSDHCMLSDENDFVEVTEWKNGEGFDVVISSKQGNQMVQVTWGEFELIKKLITILQG